MSIDCKFYKMCEVLGESRLAAVIQHAGGAGRHVTLAAVFRGAARRKHGL